MTFSRPLGIDLFAGAGGLSLGFEQAGFDVAAAVEIDPIHCAVHEFNFPYSTARCASVVDLTGVAIRQRAGLGDREIDVVFGGAPCQGFSLIGKRALDDAIRALLDAITTRFGAPTLEPLSTFGVMAPGIFGVMAPLRSTESGVRTDLKHGWFFRLWQLALLRLARPTPSSASVDRGTYCVEYTA